MNRKSLLSHSTIAIVCFMFGVLLMYPIGTSVLWNVSITEKFSQPLQGKIDVVIIRSDGTIEEYYNDNLVVTIGLTRARTLLYGGASDPTNVTDDIALSNDATPLAGWTELDNEITGNGLARADGTESVIDADTYQVVHTFTATGTETVQCAGLHWASDSGLDNTLFSAGTFTQVTLNNNDQIQITWTIDFSSG